MMKSLDQSHKQIFSQKSISQNFLLIVVYKFPKCCQRDQLDLNDGYHRFKITNVIQNTYEDFRRRLFAVYENTVAEYNRIISCSNKCGFSFFQLMRTIVDHLK